MANWGPHTFLNEEKKLRKKIEFIKSTTFQTSNCQIILPIHFQMSSGIMETWGEPLKPCVGYGFPTGTDIISYNNTILSNAGICLFLALLFSKLSFPFLWQENLFLWLLVGRTRSKKWPQPDWLLAMQIEVDGLFFKNEVVGIRRWGFIW